jgi:hypothetical protein
LEPRRRLRKRRLRSFEVEWKAHFGRLEERHFEKLSPEVEDEPDGHERDADESCDDGGEREIHSSLPPPKNCASTSAMMSEQRMTTEAIITPPRPRRGRRRRSR